MHKRPILLTYIGFLFTGAGVVIALCGCRIAQKGKVDTFDEADAGNARSGSPAGLGSRAMPGGDPRVSLVNAPCGNSPDTEVFLARSKARKLTNQLGKLPASSWKVTDDGRSVSICSLMASRGMNLALFYVFRAGCAPCEDTIRQAAESLADLQKKSGSTTAASKARIIAIESGVLAERSADPAMPVIYAADPTGQLLRTLSSGSNVDLMPMFVAHRSGYGFFSNSPGAARDSLGADFEALANDP